MGDKLFKKNSHYAVSLKSCFWCNEAFFRKDEMSHYTEKFGLMGGGVMGIPQPTDVWLSGTFAKWNKLFCPWNTHVSVKSYPAGFLVRKCSKNAFPMTFSNN